MFNHTLIYVWKTKQKKNIWMKKKVIKSLFINREIEFDSIDLTLLLVDNVLSASSEFMELDPCSSLVSMTSSDFKGLI